jgi:cytochrome c-type biogenesis protein CcmH/NrfG
VKHKQRHQVAATASVGERPGPALGERPIFLFAFVCLAAGIAIGYMLRGIVSPGMVAPATRSIAPPAALTEAPQVSLDSAVEPVEAALKADPGNARLLIELGNIYYDHHVYSKAITYYQHALQFDPRNVNVRTDLGTAYVYAGLPKQAVTEYQQALAINPRHFQTLFNLGVAYDTGLKDPGRAISTWKTLLRLYPENPDRSRVERLIQSAKQEEDISKAVR